MIMLHMFMLRMHVVLMCSVILLGRIDRKGHQARCHGTGKYM